MWLVYDLKVVKLRASREWTIRALDKWENDAKNAAPSSFPLLQVNSLSMNWNCRSISKNLALFRFLDTAENIVIFSLT